MLVLKAVVPSAAHQDVIDFIDNIEDVAVVRGPPHVAPDDSIDIRDDLAKHLAGLA